MHPDVHPADEILPIASPLGDAGLWSAAQVVDKYYGWSFFTLGKSLSPLDSPGGHTPHDVALESQR
jgi:hypothetical protein